MMSRNNDRENGYGYGMEDDMLGMFGSAPLAGANQQTSEGGDPLDRIFNDALGGGQDGNPMAGGPPPAEQQGSSGGNTDRARELHAPSAPLGGYGGGGAEPMRVPEGVTVAPTSYSNVPASSNTMSAPATPRAPSPSVGGSPLVNPGGETRRPPLESSGASAALFGAPEGGDLFGGAGGLNEGGYGLPGMGGTAPPTKLMQALFDALNRGV